MLYQRGRAYSQDLRERVFAAWDDGERVGEVAELRRVSFAYVSKALTRRRTTGETTVRAQHGHKLPKLAPVYAAIRAYVAERGDTTIANCDVLLARTIVGRLAHVEVAWPVAQKSRSGQPSRIDRTSPKPGWSGARTSRR